MPTTSSQHRTDWLDHAKGIGILLVVYAHLLSSGYHAGLTIPEQFFQLSDSIIYSFHMPLFFFLSGMFIETSLQKRGTKGYLLDKLQKIAYPYLIWSVLQVSVEVIFSAQTQRGAQWENVFAVAYRPWGQFWFLYALLVLHIIYALATHYLPSSKMILAILALVLFFFPIKTAYFALFGASTHLLFFISGMLLKDKCLALSQREPSIWVAIAPTTLLIASGIFVFQNILPPARLVGAGVPFYHLSFSILGIFSVILLSQYLAKHTNWNPLQLIGQYSLQILLVHMLAGVAMRMVLLQLFHIQNWIIHITFCTLIAILGPIVLDILTHKIGFPYLFTPPQRQSASSST